MSNEWMFSDLRAAGYDIELAPAANGRTAITVYRAGQRAYYNVCRSGRSAVKHAYNYLTERDKQRGAKQ